MCKNVCFLLSFIVDQTLRVVSYKQVYVALHLLRYFEHFRKVKQKSNNLKSASINVQYDAFQECYFYVHKALRDVFFLILICINIIIRHI